jgi:hypothetical protein
MEKKILKILHHILPKNKMMNKITSDSGNLKELQEENSWNQKYKYSTSSLNINL